MKTYVRTHEVRQDVPVTPGKEYELKSYSGGFYVTGENGIDYHINLLSVDEATGTLLFTTMDEPRTKPRVQCEVWIYRKPEGYLEFQEAPYSKAAIVHFGLTLLARIPIDVEEGHGLEGGE